MASAARPVVDWLIDLARRSSRRLMIRLVKGAYWDSEIKRAQVDGLDGFPVFTRKVYTDVSFLACARKLLAAPDAVYPQFATHNAQTLASVLVFAGPDFYRGQYEFQCLHGMGEPLYEEVVGRDKLNRPCRVYAPVGSHETLLAYLVRRLLENGANTSFVNRIADASVSIDDLVADPAEAARSIQPIGAPHDKIAAPRDLYAPDRVNSRGLDLSDEGRLAKLDDGLNASAEMAWRAFPPGAAEDEPGEPVLNPANRSDIVGFTRHARADEIAAALDIGDRAAPAFAAIPPSERAIVLRRAADILEARNDLLVGLIVREAGKSYANAVAEVREAADFLRYYAHEATRTLLPGSPAALGLVVCISPWNFPLAIFTGQVAAALAAGNSVIAKPAEETPLIAAEAVRVLHEAGVPPRCAAAHARRRRSWRGAGRRPTRPGRRLHRLDAGRSTDRKRACRPPHAPRRALAPDRRNRRPQRDGRRFLGARRAGRRRRPVVGLRFGGAALFGFAHPLPAGRCRRPHAHDAEGRDGRARGRRSAQALGRRRPGHHRGGARCNYDATSKKCAVAATR